MAGGGTNTTKGFAAKGILKWLTNHNKSLNKIKYNLLLILVSVYIKTLKDTLCLFVKQSGCLEGHP